MPLTDILNTLVTSVVAINSRSAFGAPIAMTGDGPMDLYVTLAGLKAATLQDVTLTVDAVITRGTQVISSGQRGVWTKRDRTSLAEASPPVRINVLSGDSVQVYVTSNYVSDTTATGRVDLRVPYPAITVTPTAVTVTPTPVTVSPTPPASLDAASLLAVVSGVTTAVTAAEGTQHNAITQAIATVGTAVAALHQATGVLQAMQQQLPFSAPAAGGGSMG